MYLSIEIIIKFFDIKNITSVCNDYKSEDKYTPEASYAVYAPGRSAYVKV